MDTDILDKRHLMERKPDLSLGGYICSNGFGKFSRKIRIPVSGSIVLADEIKNIIDTADFQRLRGVRQLGPAIFVYPGANHTRYEHSLGTCNLALKYIERLFDQPDFKKVGYPYDETIKLIVLATLLHDIGHYPYSHWIEEVKEFPRHTIFKSHEDRASDIICNGRIGGLIKDQWGVKPEKVCDVIAGRNLDTARDGMINFFLDSAIDVDKLDYLVRDSVHCGVNYGQGIDIERLLDSLWVDQSTNGLCVTDKGKSCLLSIITCRNIMYREVYWHKTVRACDAMFKRFVYEFLRLKLADKKALNQYFERPDDYFIATLTEKAREKNQERLVNLARPFSFGDRLLYKPAYSFSLLDQDEPVETRKFFEEVLTGEYKSLVRRSKDLAMELKRYIHDLTPIDIIIEKTPIKKGHSDYELDDFHIWNIRKEKFEACSPEVKSLNSSLNMNASAFIFCNPIFYREMRQLVFNGTLNKILKELG
jgi:uncharacterized protein